MDGDEALLRTLAERFAANPGRHAGIGWAEVAARLAARPESLAALAAMERTGGEPDGMGREAAGGVVFADCAAESPAGRRSLAYDRAAREGRKANPPASGALEMAAGMGVALLTEAEYQALQTLGAFDRRTSSWIATPAPVRRLGGALFGDRRYDRVFTYHNGADAYYAARGFRARLVV